MRTEGPYKRLREVVPPCVKSSLLRVDMGISISWPYRVNEAIFVSSHEVLAGGCFRWVLAPVRDLVARLLLARRWGFRCLTFELQRLVDQTVRNVCVL